MFGKKYVIYVTRANGNSGYLSNGPGGEEQIAPTTSLARQFNSLTAAALKAFCLRRKNPGTVTKSILDPRLTSLDGNKPLRLHNNPRGSALCPRGY